MLAKCVPDTFGITQKPFLHTPFLPISGMVFATRVHVHMRARGRAGGRGRARGAGAGAEPPAEAVKARAG